MDIITLPTDFIASGLAKTKDQAPGNTARLLKSVFEQLNTSEIAYCVLRNYDTLPQLFGNDVDLLVDENCIEDAGSLLLQTASECGWRVVKKQTRYGYHSYCLAPCDGTNVVRIEFLGPCHWKGITWMSTETVLNRRVKRDIFYIPSSGSEAAVLVLKDILSQGYVKERYRQRIVEFAEEDSEGFCATICGPFGQEVTQRLLEKVLAGDWENLATMRPLLRRKIIMRVLSDATLGQFTAWLKFVWGHLRERMLHPSGFFLVLVGPDGAGKSTVASGVSRSLHKVFYRPRIFHFRPGLLPDLGAIYGRMRALLCGNAPPERANESNTDVATGRMGWLLRLGYYTADFILGRFPIWQVRSRGDLVIFDRYYYEYIIQQPRTGLPGWLIGFLAKLVPSPDAVVYLHNTPEGIRERKQELTLDEIRSQAKRYGALVRELPNAYQVDAGGDLETVLDKVSSVVLNRMADRYQNAYSIKREADRSMEANL
jgi:thymidylate kinase